MKSIAIVVLSVISFSVVAQHAEPLIFNEKTHDFGEINEALGNANYEFSFTNNAARPVTILSVHPSCGCTTPDWSKEPIAPGKSGFIKVSFDPRGKPGYFSKSLTITTDLDGNSIVLLIKGQVVSAVKPVGEVFTTANGNLRLRSNSFNLGKIYLNKEPAVAEFEMYNDGDKAVQFSEKVVAPAYIKVTPPAVIPAKGKGKLKITYDAKIKNQYGFVSDNIELETDDESLPRKPFSVYATIEEYYPPLTASELSKAPSLWPEFSSLDLGRAKSGTTLRQNLRIKNLGKLELIIHAIQPNCTCISLPFTKVRIKPGEETTLPITFDSQGRKGTQQKAITLYSNDPRYPVQRITLMAYIEE